MDEPRHTSTIQLSRSALKRNLGFIRRWIGRGVRLSSVIKGNAYGHGIEPFVELAEDLGVRHFAVFDAHEASRVLASRTRGSGVMIMGMIDDHDLGWAIANDIEVYVFDPGRLEAAIATAGRVGRPARIHLEVETGLHRTGFEPDQLDTAIETIRRHSDDVVLEGLCTHLAGAESISNYYRIHDQIERFTQATAQLAAAGLKPQRRHVACSAAALAYPSTILDMVRIGILQYGFWPTQETRIYYHNQTGKMDNPLRQVIRWSSSIMSLKQVERGDFIGYGTTYQAARRSRIASIPVGYGHGYARALSNQGRILVRGRRVGVIGIVNMNLLMADVTSVPGVQVGDEVVLIGKQGKSTVPVTSFAELSNLLNYELLTRLPREIPRVVTD